MPKKSPAKRKTSKKKQTPEEIAEERIAKWKQRSQNPGLHSDSLDLEGLGLVTFPESLRDAHGLESLDLGYNSLST
jgi:hypothetical protein